MKPIFSCNIALYKASYTLNSISDSTLTYDAQFITIIYQQELTYIYKQIRNTFNTEQH